MATGKLVSLSEQNLVDCSDAEGNMGCDGGLMDQAFNYTVINKGIDTEASYPYKAVDQQCMFNASNVGATISKWTDIPSGSEPDLMKAIATVGPISVAIDASEYTFQLYSSGIYYDPNCSSQFLDHGVLAVGYGSKKTGTNKDYYLVKNSWGTDWGMKGYIEMSRNRNNNCGIATQSSSPSAAPAGFCPGLLPPKLFPARTLSFCSSSRVLSRSATFLEFLSEICFIFEVTSLALPFFSFLNF